ncbi:F-box only protein 21 like protein [Argiope bruennichi]|uniref:F-box only protein 21 like protein n=1 Tax=Argiope bruennichi TaxID=94029 RepID=A0A8T0FC42_ARGBR|nr:F-box only protein 21 like protein [Argiope bruennichi]
MNENSVCFENLPSEIIENIFNCDILSFVDLCRISCVSQSLNLIARSNKLWRRKFALTYHNLTLKYYAKRALRFMRHTYLETLWHDFLESDKKSLLKAIMSPENNYIDKVLMAKAGYPSTLSVIYATVAAQLGVNCLPVCFPGHFLLKWAERPYMTGGDSFTYIDVHDGGTFKTMDTLTDLTSGYDRLSESWCEAISPVRLKCQPRDGLQGVEFAVGMIMKHKKYKYRCVIYGWDVTCAAGKDWITSMGVYELKYKDQQPFYLVLVDDGTNRYAAQENLECDYELKPIMHGEIGRYFESFHGTYYFPNEQKLQEYPDDTMVREQVLNVNPQFFCQEKDKA